MIIKTEYKEEATHNEWGDHTSASIVFPKELPGKNGAIIVMVKNLKYFLEMYAPGYYDHYQRPYEILTELDDKVRADACNGKMSTYYWIDYKSIDPTVEDDSIGFKFSHFEVNSETEPDEDFRSLYVIFEFIYTEACPIC